MMVKTISVCENIGVIAYVQRYRVSFEDDFALYGCCECDYLEIFTGNDSSLINSVKRGRWYGDDSPYQFIIDGPMYVLFRTDVAGNDIGFHFNYVSCKYTQK